MTDRRLSHRAKLTPNQVREIRRILATEPVSYAALARRFGVSEPTISQIANYQTWRDPVEAPPAGSLSKADVAGSQEEQPAADETAAPSVG